MSDDKVPAAVVLVLRNDGMVLGITRGDSPWAWHLPGGKKELGETIVRTAARELDEETWVRVQEPELVPLCEFTSTSGRHVHAFKCEPSGLPERFDATLAGQPAWVPPSLLVAECMPFREECRRILTAAGVLENRSVANDVAFYKRQCEQWRAASETALSMASAAQERIAEIEGNGSKAGVGDRVRGTFLGTLEATRMDGYLVRDADGYAMMCDGVMCVKSKDVAP